MTDNSSRESIRSMIARGQNLCTRWHKEQYEATRDLDQVKAAFDIQLRNLGTDYLDIGMLHKVSESRQGPGHGAGNGGTALQRAWRTRR